MQERVLAIASETLAPNGVAFVSYNALPGCHVAECDAPDDAVARAGHGGTRRENQTGAGPRPVSRGGLAAAARSFPPILKDTLDHQARQPDPVLFHDDLSDVNEPLLFVDFIERASRHRLKFLSEADYCDMAVWDADSDAGRFLLEVGAENVILQQQYRDFLIFRRFRQTLLCREDAAAAREPDPDVLRSLSVSASSLPESGNPDIASDQAVTFKTEKEGDLTTPHPLSKAAFLELGMLWPRWVSVPDLVAAARARVSAAGGRSVTTEDEVRLLRFLLAAYGANVTRLHHMTCPFVTEISERPRVSALARLQARTSTQVTNLRHQSVRLEDPLVRRFLQLLDGTRDRAAIENEMAAALREAGPEAGKFAADVDAGVALNFGHVSRLALLEG